MAVLRAPSLCFSVDGLAGDEANSLLQHLARSLSVKWDRSFSEILGCMVARSGICIASGNYYYL